MGHPYVGTSKSKPYVGTSKCKAIYQGTTKIWSSGSVLLVDSWVKTSYNYLFGDDINNCVKSNKSLSGYRIVHVCTMNGITVGVGETTDSYTKVKLFYSTDLINWNEATGYPANTFAYGGKVYFYEGFFYTHVWVQGQGTYFMKSSDGKSWTTILKAAIGGTRYYLTMAYNPSNGVIVISDCYYFDGILSVYVPSNNTWSTKSFTGQCAIFKGKFWMTSGGIYYSSDGQLWTFGTNGINFGTAIFCKVVGDKLFCVGALKCAYTTDGVTWTAFDTPSSFNQSGNVSNNMLKDIGFYNEKYYLFGSDANQDVTPKQPQYQSNALAAYTTNFVDWTYVNDTDLYQYYSYTSIS